MLAVDPQLTMPAARTAPILVIAIERYARQMDQAARRERKAVGVVAALVMEFLSAMHVAQASALQGLEPSPSVRSTASAPSARRGMRPDVPGARG